MEAEATKLNADLIRAIKTNAVSLFEDVLNRGASVDARDQYNATVLVLAVEHKRFPMVERLLALGANVNSNREKLPMRPWSALHAAAENDSTEITELLLKQRADIHSFDIWHKQTPLHVACAAGNLNQVKVLLDHGAKAEGDKLLSSNSALMTALFSDKLDVAAYLLSRNPNSISEPDGNGKTPLMFFAYWKDHEKVAWLLSQQSPDWVVKKYFRNAAAEAVMELDDFEQEGNYETARAATIELFRQHGDL